MVGERIVVTVEKLASGGDGIAFLAGRTFFIPFSIPGEKLLCEISETSKDYSRATIVDILTASPYRVKPLCPIFGICGGCNLQHIEYGRQLELKTESVREAFRRIAKFDPGEIAARPSSPYGYRNRAQFHFTGDHGIGFMEAESASSVRAEGCPVAVRVIDDWLHKQNRKSRPDKELQARIGMRDRFVVFGQDERLYIEGMDAHAKAVVAGREYRFPLKHFFQSNLEAASTLITDALAGLSGNLAVDLYSGAGLFAAGLALHFKKVVCVESDTVSLEAARGNVPTGAGEFHPMDVESWAQATSARTRRGGAQHFDWILADPPRAGLSLATKEWLKNSDSGGFTYVSCDHVTMARDIGDLILSGWRLESMTVHDFYPQTGRIEALARLLPPRDRTSQGG